VKQMDLDLLRKELEYNPSTGEWKWKISKQKVRLGMRAGSAFYNGGLRYQIFYRGKNYQAGPLAWFYVKGEWPKGDIDHIDHNPLNNRWSNLRDVTHAENLRNSHRARDGVYRNGGGWQFNIDGKYAGWAKTEEEARRRQKQVRR